MLKTRKYKIYQFAYVHNEFNTISNISEPGSLRSLIRPPRYKYMYIYIVPYIIDSIVPHTIRTSAVGVRIAAARRWCKPMPRIDRRCRNHENWLSTVRMHACMHVHTVRCSHDKSATVRRRVNALDAHACARFACNTHTHDCSTRERARRLRRLVIYSPMNNAHMRRAHIGNTMWLCGHTTQTNSAEFSAGRAERHRSAHMHIIGPTASQYPMRTYMHVARRTTTTTTRSGRRTLAAAFAARALSWRRRTTFGTFVLFMRSEQ